MCPVEKGASSVPQDDGVFSTFGNRSIIREPGRGGVSSVSQDDGVFSAFGNRSIIPRREEAFSPVSSSMSKSSLDASCGQIGCLLEAKIEQGPTGLGPYMEHHTPLFRLEFAGGLPWIPPGI